MINKKEVLKMVRKVINENDIKVIDFKPTTIRSIMYGQRNNDVIMKEILKQAIQKSQEITKNIEYFLYTNYQNPYVANNFKKRHKFLLLSESQKIEYLCKLSGLKDIDMLKKELQTLNQFELLNDNVRWFLQKPNKNQLKLLRATRKFD